jgi:hypothetical protein
MIPSDVIVPFTSCLVFRARHSTLALICLLGLAGATCSPRAEAGGTWVGIVHPPPVGLNNAMLMTDGSVLCGDGGSGWHKFTPDSTGNYANGTWTTVASTTYTRLFYSSQVLPNGNVYVAGGEYGTGKTHAELYNYLSNTWSVISQPAGASYSDAISMLLPNGNVLQGTTGSGVYIYNSSTNTIVAGPQAPGNQNETDWVRLPNDNILTINAFGQTTSHYVPSLNAWYPDGNTPTNLFGYGGEMGSGHVLPNGKVFFIGASSNTAIYTPGASLTAAGTWVSGATIPNDLGAVDAPACMMNNGKILCALGTNTGFGSTTYFYEYDYVSNTFTLVDSPSGGTSYGQAEFATTMLQLPDGGVFFIGGQNSTYVKIYYPDGARLAQGKPTVSSIRKNADGSYHLTGVGLCGISQGAQYGDDWQMDSNYPIVRLTDGSGNVRYCRTYNWSNSSVQNPNPVSTEFTLPPGLPSGNYSLEVVTNGNPSDGTAFSTGGVAGTAFFEAESLTINANTDTVDAVAADLYSDGWGDILRADAVNDSVTYLLPNIQAGTYTITVGMKKWTSRGSFQLSGSRADVSTWSNIGSIVDEYDPNGGGVWTEVNVGTWSPGSSNDKLFKFTVTGKNANSSAFYLSVDYIRLTKQ